jgi:hypothetical protein
MGVTNTSEVHDRKAAVVEAQARATTQQREKEREREFFG